MVEFRTPLLGCSTSCLKEEPQANPGGQPLGTPAKRHVRELGTMPCFVEARRLSCLKKGAVHSLWDADWMFCNLCPGEESKRSFG